MPIPNRQYESMLYIRVDIWDVRVWRTEKEFGDWSNQDIKDALKRIAESGERTGNAISHTHIAGIIENFHNVAAYEILDIVTRNGFIVYPDWK